MKEPIIVYQMGKVGSSSIYKSLKNAGIEEAYQVHRMNPEVISNRKAEKSSIAIDKLGSEIYDKYIAKNHPAKIISMTREPVSRNVSAFFNNFDVVMEFNDKGNIHDLANDYIRNYPHQVPFTWFDTEVKATLGIDVYDYPFSCEDGYLQVKNGPFDLLVLNLELPDETKQAIIANFIEMKDFKLIKAYESKDKDYASAYRKFQKNIRFSKIYLDMMYDTLYARHFYNNSAIEKLYEKWSE